MKRKIFGALCAIFLLSTSMARTEEPFFFKDKDRVVMIGDSITEQHLYSNYVEMWTVTRYPAWQITFRNVGIGGDRSTGGNSRFARDVLIHKPTAMTVDFGMNDGNYRAFDDAGFKTYMNGLQGMADQAKKADIRVAWITPQPLDNGNQGPTALTDYNLTLEKYSEGVKAIAEKNHGLFVDQFHPYLEVLNKARTAGNKYDRITGGDAVHPGGPGQALMAASILKGLHFPSQVAAIEIDIPAGKISNTINCKGSQLKVDGEHVHFVQEDAALPFFPDEAKSILKWIPLQDQLNLYTLKVVGLKGTKYAVSVGNQKVAEYSGEELAKGVNLAEAVLAVGPIADQVKAVRKAIEAKNKYYHDGVFRGVTLSYVPDWVGSHQEIEAKREAEALKRIAKLPEFDAAIRAALVIKPHEVAIAPISK